MKKPELDWKYIYKTLFKRNETLRSENDKLQRDIVVLQNRVEELEKLITIE